MRVALGHVAGTLLVAHEDVADRRIDEGVVDGQDRAAREAEHDLHPFHLEALDEGLGPTQLHRCSWDRVRGAWLPPDVKNPSQSEGRKRTDARERRALSNYEDVGGVRHGTGIIARPGGSVQGILRGHGTATAGLRANGMKPSALAAAIPAATMSPPER